jgi:hypothetical protein
MWSLQELTLLDKVWITAEEEHESVGSPPVDWICWPLTLGAAHFTTAASNDGTWQCSGIDQYDRVIKV